MCPKNQSATNVEIRPALNILQTRLLERARKRCGADIEPCAGKNWGESFLDCGKYGYFLYFNDSTGNTHVEREGGERVQS